MFFFGIKKITSTSNLLFYLQLNNTMALLKSENDVLEMKITSQQDIVRKLENDLSNSHVSWTFFCKFCK